MSEFKHTPTPWTIGRGKSGLSFGLFGTDGREIASSSWHDSSPHYPTQATTAANFEFIAEVANSHADLTEERDRLREENSRFRMALDEIATNEEYRDLTAEEAKQVARAALSPPTAEGRE